MLTHGLLNRGSKITGILCIIFLFLGSLTCEPVWASTPATSSPLLHTLVSLDFTPSDAVMNPQEPIIYLTDGVNKRVVAVNLQTQQKTVLSTDLTPEHLTYANGELFVTLVKGSHVEWTEVQNNGAVAIINPESMTLTQEFNVDTDPYEIQVDAQGHIYVSSGSTQASRTPGSPPWSPLLVYSRQTLQEVSTFVWPFDRLNLLLLQPGTNTLFSMSTDIPAKTLGTYHLSDNTLYQDRNYLGTYDHLDAPLRFSPDGEYLFDASGEVLDPQFKLVTILDPFTDIAFDPVSKAYYTASTKDHSIQEYWVDNQNSNGFNMMKKGTVYESSGQVSYLFYQNADLFAVSKSSSGQFQVESIPITPRNPYVPNLYMKKIVPLDFTPTQTIIDPGQPILYFTDQEQDKVYSYNYVSQFTNSVSLPFPPERIAYDKGELYVTLLKGSLMHSKDTPGEILILNASTLQTVDQINLTFDPSDLAVRDGTLVVFPGPKSIANITSFSRQTHNVTATQYGLLGGQLAQLSPTRSRIYTVDTITTSNDMHYLDFDSSSLTHPTTWTSHASYFADSTFRISPDGTRILNGDGEVFDQDLNHLASLGHTFTDFAFSSDAQRVFAADSSLKLIRIYNRDATGTSYSEVSGFSTLGQSQSLFCRDGELISVSMNPERDQISDAAWLEFFPLAPENPGNLKLETIYPTASSQHVSVSGPSFLGFNDQVFTGNPSSIVLRDAHGNIVSTKASLKAMDNLLFLMFDRNLSYNSKYSVSFSGLSALDASGAGFDGASFSFTTGQEYTRLAGQDRYETAAQISQLGWSKSSVVILATGEDFPDALSAAPLAKKYGAPILLTQPNELPASTERELTRLKAQKILIVGGEGAVSAKIETQLKNEGLETERIQGADRYATSVAIAKYLGLPSEVFLATGDSFPDALSIASYAAQKQIPILLTTRDTLPAATQNYLQHHKISKTYVIGGEGVISTGLTYQVQNAERIGGKDRYSTNLAVLEKFGFDFSDTFFATGENFPDALAGSALAGAGSNPVLLLSRYTSQDILQTLAENKSMMKMKYLLGGESILPTSLIERIFTN